MLRQRICESRFLWSVFPTIVVLAAFIPGLCKAQAVRNISGKITDSQTGEPLPYVTVYVKQPNHSTKGTTTDFNGQYHLAAPIAPGDTVFASYVGYLRASKLLPRTTPAVVDFQLSADNTMLASVNVSPKGYVNPAWEILANMVKHKPENNQDKLKGYSFESYSRLDLSVTNISDRMKARKLMRQILPLMDSLKKIAGDDGTPVLPVFMSETVSEFAYQGNPQQKSEKIVHTRASGVGVEDETLISQIVGSTFQQYNFYRNYVRIANKDFISPVTDSWKTFYNYELTNRSEIIDGKEYYRIEFQPKRSHDLAFVGVMWVTKNSYAIYRIDANVTPDANLDFLNKIRIQQQMIQPQAGTAWLPEKTRITIHVGNIAKNWSGFLGRFYISNSKMDVNPQFNENTFKEPLIVANDAASHDEKYWSQSRPEPLSSDDQKVYKMIDTIKNMPLVRTYADIAGMLINGYYRPHGGKFSFGPYMYTYSYNDVQGSVLRLGGTTNRFFSNKLILSGYLSYGFRDRKLNYSGAVDYVFSRKPWSQAGVSFTRDLGQTGYQFENFAKTNNVFRASQRNGRITRRGPFQTTDIRAYAQTNIWQNWQAKVTIDRRTFDPLYNFEYFSRVNNQRYNNYQVAEAIAELQWQPGRRVLQSTQTNRRIMLGDGTDNPVITFRYTHGFRGVAGGDFNYNKYHINVQQKMHMGILGKGEYAFTGGYIPSTLPSPLLENHRFNFNTMRFLEFASDRYLSLTYTQHMEGLLTNSIPLLKELNIRTVADFNILDGTLSDENGGQSSMRRPSRSLKSDPYVEVGYGVENILKFLRVDFLHRLTHQNHLDESGNPPSKFATRVTVQFRL